VTNGVRAMVEAMESAGAKNPVLESSQLGDPDIWGGFGR
jgi:hypothetical protein